MSILSDLAEAWPLALIAGGVGFVIAFGRDPKADEHDLSDYFEPTPTAAQMARRRLAPNEDEQLDVIWNRADTRSAWPLVDRKPMPARPAGAHAAPVDLTDVPWTPPYAELTVAAVVRRHGDSPADIADRWLREIAAEQRTLVGAR